MLAIRSPAMLQAGIPVYLGGDRRGHSGVAAGVTTWWESNPESARMTSRPVAAPAPNLALRKRTAPRYRHCRSTPRTSNGSFSLLKEQRYRSYATEL